MICPLLLLAMVAPFGLFGTAMAQTHAPHPLHFPLNTPKDDLYAKCINMLITYKDTEVVCTPRGYDSLENITNELRRIHLKYDPIEAGQNGDREALRHLPDVSPNAASKQLAEINALKARYQALDTKGFEGEDKLNTQLLGYVLDQETRLAKFDTARIPFTNDSGFFNMLSYVYRQTEFKTVDDYEAYAARLSELPRFFSQHMANMRRGIATGFTASDQIMPGIVAQIKALSESAPAKGIEDNTFFSPFKTYPDTIPKAEQDRLRALGQETIKTKVLPAYKDLLDFMQNEYLPAARKTVGIGSTPEGRAYYKALVKQFTTLDLTPDEVHQIGLDEVARIRAEMDGVIKKTGFKGSFKEFLHFLRTDPQFYAKTPEDLLKQASWIAKRIDGKLPHYFGTLPRLPYGVMAVPDEIAPNYTTGRYWGGNPEQGLAGFFVVNTYDLSQRPLYNLPALALHEGVPGHHLQISLAQEMKNVPEFRQSLYPNAFGEGWGLYAEKLGKEMGIYQTPYEDFGRLTYEMWRACRLVVDTGMHWKGWNRAQAEKCFLDNTALSKHNIKTEVDRYISWPGQALSYKLGELKILELRQRAEQALGADFEIRKFHDEVLGAGGIPLDILEERINTWIQREQSTHRKTPAP